MIDWIMNWRCWTYRRHSSLIYRWIMGRIMIDTFSWKNFLKLNKTSSRRIGWWNFNKLIISWQMRHSIWNWARSVKLRGWRVLSLSTFFRSHTFLIWWWILLMWRFIRSISLSSSKCEIWILLTHVMHILSILWPQPFLTLIINLNWALFIFCKLHLRLVRINLS